MVDCLEIKAIDALIAIIKTVVYGNTCTTN